MRKKRKQSRNRYSWIKWIDLITVLINLITAILNFFS